MIIIYRVPPKKVPFRIFLDCLLIAHFLLPASDFAVCCNQTPAQGEGDEQTMKRNSKRDFFWDTLYISMISIFIRLADATAATIHQLRTHRRLPHLQRCQVSR